jgi:hypothetical protein
MKAFVIMVFCVVLGACKQDSKTTDNTAPVLNGIGNKELAVGDTLSLVLQATDADGDELRYTSDGTVGPDKDPYAQTTPAVFDSSAAKFEWTPTSTELGDYSLQFTVTDSTGQPLSASETISISVMTTSDYGGALYAKYCVTCHGVDGTGGGANIRGKTAVAISTALQNVIVMQPLQDVLNTHDIEHLAERLAHMPHILYELSLACVACHDGAPLAGKSIGHARTTDHCAACHTLDTWRVLKMDHTQLDLPRTCADCHSSPNTAGFVG